MSIETPKRRNMIYHYFSGLVFSIVLILLGVATTNSNVGLKFVYHAQGAVPIDCMLDGLWCFCLHLKRLETAGTNLNIWGSFCLQSWENLRPKKPNLTTKSMSGCCFEIWWRSRNGDDQPPASIMTYHDLAMDDQRRCWISSSTSKSVISARHRIWFVGLIPVRFGFKGPWENWCYTTTIWCVLGVNVAM